MGSLLLDRRTVNGRRTLEHIIEESYAALEQMIAYRITLWLEAAVTQLLGREPYVRRQRVPYWVEQKGCRTGQNRKGAVLTTRRERVSTSVATAADRGRWVSRIS